MTKQFVQAVFITAVFLCSSCNILAQDAFTQNLTQNVSIANSMTVDKFTQLMQQGFKSVIVHRPDNEAGNLVSVSQLRDIAEKKRIGVIYQPIEQGQINPKDIAEFAQYFNELPKPILLICRSGTRSALLYKQAKSQGLLHE
ncbi:MULTISPECIES: beta-lactamase hydrolase domain-containing protein [unclassified Acinetobacter]|uniref:beta-lactamase hydrolase domain-containing protein n=1 Tax=unclassified Acinetobacter TaxID=196816 RepID=UPI002934A99B|nr:MULTISPECIES: sulfur transferase domain-containing protein [unclassified Acinetobacter]WOE30463.1 sulfur transferase domain-containing protein [Acinetobacter sp. SAAs470]WOE38654.1 sulfur transferase domain-containing protein [Acinetobacter sp. SAAs474]